MQPSHRDEPDAPSLAPRPEGRPDLLAGSDAAGCGPGCGCGDHAVTADVSVGPARATDAPAVGFVQAAVWVEEFTGVLAPEVVAAFEGPSFARVWRDSLERPPARHVLLVARAGDRVVGLAAVGPSPDPDADDETAQLLVLGVHPADRRLGHGSRLLNAAVDTARDLGFEAITAWVPISSEATRGFLVGAGLDPDRARRERVVDPDGTTLLEVRLVAALGAPAPTA